MKTFLHNVLNKHLLEVGLASLILTANGGLYAQNYGVHFLGDTSDKVTGSAGVVAITNWNNITNSIMTNTTGSYTVTITNSTGSQTATLTLSGPGLSRSVDTHTTGNGGSTSLMDGYISSGWAGSAAAPVTNVISGLPSGQLFNVYIYCFGDTAMPLGLNYWLAGFSINGTNYFVATLGSRTASTYYSAGPTQITTNFAGFGFVPTAIFSTNYSSPVPNSANFGDYFVVSNVPATSGKITITTDPDTLSDIVPIDGFELVPSTTIVTPLFTNLSSHTITYGTTNQTLSGTVETNSNYLPQGTTITVNISTNSQTTTISDSTGDFSINYNTKLLTNNVYTVTYISAAANGFNRATNTSTTLTVNKMTPTLTAPTASSITYGQTLASSTLSGGPATNANDGAAVAGSFAFTTSSLMPTNTGSTNVSVTFTPTDTTDYNTATAAVSVTVNSLPVVLTGSMVYNGSTTVPASDLTVSNLVGSDNLTLSGSVTIASANVGAEAITSFSGLTLGGTAAAKYTLTGASGSVTITSSGSTNVAYGVHFLGDTSDKVTGSAGVVAISGWNNITNSIMTNTTGSYTVTITNSTGSQTATLTLSGPGLSRSVDTDTTGNGGSSSLMDGYISSGWAGSAAAPITNVISGLPSGQLFNVYIYCFGDTAMPLGLNYWLAGFSINGTNYFVATLGSKTASTYYSAGPTQTAQNFAGTGFVPATIFSTNFSSAVPNSTNFGDYFVVSNVPATSGKITITTDPDTLSDVVPIDGFELMSGSVSGGGTNAVTPQFSGLSSPTTTYGTTSVSLSGTVSTNGLYLPSGTTITVTVDGNAQQTSISGSSGQFNLGYDTVGIPASSTPYTVTYVSAAASGFNGATNTSTTMTINKLPVVLSGSMVGNGTTTVPAADLTVANLVSGDNLTLSGSVQIAGTNFGSQAITSFSGLTLGGISAANYTLTGASGSVTITSSGGGGGGNGVTNLAYGVQFLGSANDPVTAYAGVVPINGWNVIPNASLASGDPNLIACSDGSQLATLTLSGAGMNESWNNGTTGNGGDSSLNDGYIDNGWFNFLAQTTISVSGLTSGEAYNLYIYCFGACSMPNGSGNYLPGYTVNGTNYWAPTIGSGCSGYYSAGSGFTTGPWSQVGYVKATLFTTNFATPVPNSSDYGDYIVISNVVATSGQITIETDPDTLDARCPINGFELVPVSVSISTNVTPQFSGLSSLMSTYGNIVTLSGTVSSGSSHLPFGTVVTATVDGNEQRTSIYDSTGDFRLSYNTLGIPASGSAYTITYASGGVPGFNSTNNTSTTMTINQLPVSLAGAMAYSGSTTVPASDVYPANLRGNDNLTLSGNVTVGSASVGAETITSVGGLSLGGTSSANYTLIGAGGSVMITSTGSYTNFAAIPFLRTASSTELVVYFHDTNGWSGPVWNQMYSTNTYVVGSPSSWTLNGTPATAVYEFVTEGNQGSDYHFYLQVPPLTNGTSYALSTPYGGTNFVFNDHQMLCESIKVNQNGYSALSQTRYANFAIWLGTGGSQPISGPLPTYCVFSQTNGQIVASGTVEPGANYSIPDGSSGDYVYRINLSSVPAGGPYQIAVTGYGCSYPFGVGGNFSSRLAYVAFRGLYYQRCGIPIIQPYAWQNIRLTPCHTNIYDDEYINSSDETTVNTNGPTIMVHGGYHDASDAQRNAYAMEVPAILMTMYEAFPQYFTSNQFNIPVTFDASYNPTGSSNGIPDILNEANWGLMCYTNLQNGPNHPAGQVPFGTHSDNEPAWGINFDEDSEELPYATLTNQYYTSGMASGDFMYFARLIQPYNATLSAAYEAHGIAAYNAANGSQTYQEKIYYAIQYYLLSGDITSSNYIEENYNSFTIAGFPSTYDFEAGGFITDNNDIVMAPFFASYVLATNRYTDPNVVAYFESVIQQAADKEVSYVTNTAYPNGWPTYINPAVSANYFSGFFTSQGEYAYPCLLEWKLTGTQKYIDAVSQLMDYDQGLNPLGKCYLTGVGFNRVSNPESRESVYAEEQGWGGPEPGCTVYGPGVTQTEAGYGPGNPEWNAPQIPDANSLARERVYVDDLGNYEWSEYTDYQCESWPAAIYEVLAQGGVWSPAKGEPFIVPQTTNQVY